MDLKLKLFFSESAIAEGEAKAKKIRADAAYIVPGSGAVVPLTVK